MDSTIRDRSVPTQFTLQISDVGIQHTPTHQNGDANTSKKFKLVDSTVCSTNTEALQIQFSMFFNCLPNHKVNLRTQFWINGKILQIPQKGTCTPT